MNKFSLKDGLKLLAIYTFLIFLLVLAYLFFSSLNSIFSSSVWGQTLFEKVRQISVIFTSYLPQNTFWYVCALLIFGVLFFLVEDLIHLFQGKKDEVKNEELSGEEAVFEEIKKEYAMKEDPFLQQKRPALSPQKLEEELKKTTIAEEIQERILKQAYSQSQTFQRSTSHSLGREFRYSPVVYYWVSGILFFGLFAELCMAYFYPSERKNLIMIFSVLAPLILYIFWMGKAATQKLAFDSKHLYLGSQRNLFPENSYEMMYYINSRYLIFLSLYKNYHFMVFRKKKCFVPLAFFIDRFFPSHSPNRQVVFLSPWKDEEGQIVSDAFLVKKSIEYCEKNGVTVKYWPFEAQFFLIFILFVLFLLAVIML